MSNAVTHSPAQAHPLASTREEFACQYREAIAMNDAHRASINAQRKVLRADAGLAQRLRDERARRGLDNVVDWPEYFRNIGCVY